MMTTNKKSGANEQANCAANVATKPHKEYKMTTDTVKLAAALALVVVLILALAILRPGHAQAADNEELFIGAGVVGLGILAWNHADELDSEAYRGQLLAGIVQPLLEGFIEEGGISEERLNSVIDGSLPIVGGFLEHRAGRVLLDLKDAARERNDAAVLDVLKGYGMEKLGEWIVANGGWRRLWTEIDRVYPLLAQCLYRELPREGGGVRIEGVLPEAIDGLFEQGRIPVPTAEALWNSRDTLNLTRYDAWWLIEALTRNLERVEYLTDTGQLGNAPLVLTSPEWVEQGRSDE